MMFREIYKNIFKTEIRENTTYFYEEDFIKIYKFIQYNLEENLKINTNLVVEICESIAYGHPSELYRKIVFELILNRENELLQYIEEVTENVSINFKMYEKLINLNISYKSISDIANTDHLQIMGNLSKIIFKYSLLIISYSNFTNFDQWFNKTNRIDLKMLFIKLIFYDISYSNYDLYKSKCFLIRLICFLRLFPMGRMFPSIKNGYDIYTIDNVPISAEEKFYFFLYHLINYSLSEEEFESNLEFVKKSSLIKEFNIEKLDFLDKIPPSKYEILRQLAEKIEDIEQKKLILKKLLHKINLLIDENETITEHDLQLGYISGRILLTLGEKEINEVQLRFENTHRKLSLPYFYDKPYNHFKIKTFNPKGNWDNCISKMVYYLISLCSINVDLQKKMDLIEKYLQIKNNLSHYNDRTLNFYIEKIKISIDEKNF